MKTSPQPKPNFTAAFVEFSKGKPLDVVALETGIPEHDLLKRARDEKWNALVPAVATPALAVATISGSETEEATIRVRSNRERNLAVVKELQDDLEEVVKQLRQGLLKVERQTARGVTFTSGPNLKDRLDLVNYAKGIQELSYRALGDVVTGTESGTGPASGTITLILPSIISRPRNDREEVTVLDHTTIDIPLHDSPKETIPAQTGSPSLRVQSPGDEEGEL